MENIAQGRARYYRTALVTFLIGLGLGLMARELAISAYAQVMDPGQQRNEMNQGISQLNAKMSEMLTVLRTGTLKVRVVGTDKTGGTVPTASFDSGEGAGRKTGEAKTPRSIGGAGR